MNPAQRALPGAFRGARRDAPRTALTAGLTAALTAGVLLGAAAAPAAAQDDPFLYSMNDRGILSVGGTQLEKLPGKFDPGGPSNTGEQWVDLLVEGSDRWALRLDGRMHRNDARIRTLPTVPDDATTGWLRMSRSDATYAVRSDGMVAVDDDTSTNYNRFAFFFVDIEAPDVSPFTAGLDAFVMRSDGAVFGGDALTPGMMFAGGAGVTGVTDGLFVDTLWVALSRDPTTGFIYALRADGQLHFFDPTDFDASSGIDPGDVITPPGPFGEGDPAPPTSSLITTLPGPSNPVNPAELWIELTFDSDGTWYAIRQDGLVHSSADPDVAFVDLPGNGVDPERTFVDLKVLDGALYALRFDGFLFRDDQLEPIIDLDKQRYRRLGLSLDPPDLAGIKNRKPVATTYKVTLLEGEAADIPVIVTDVDKPADELTLAVDLSLLPGATWDEVTRTVSFPGATAGKYRFTVEVDDEASKKPKRFKYSVKVVPQDTNELKNRPPTPAKMKKFQALVGFELSVPVLATDRDGDALTMTADTSKGIFARGATFDPGTGIVTWTPAFEDIGKASGVILVSDGIKTKKLKVKVTVINPLIF